jgi:hypothetical protein
MYSGCTMGISHHKKHDLAVTFFGVLKGWGTWKFCGVAISNEDWRVRTLRGNEFGEIHTADS